MNLADILIVVFGLAFFEIVSSLDNSVVNADILNTIEPRWRKWFLRYGLIFAVFGVRGLLPLFIIYFSSPGLGLYQSFAATFGSNAGAKEIIQKQTPILLAGGGIFLLFLFLHWFFLETKKYVFFIEKKIHERYYFWFYALAAIILLSVVWLTIKINPLIALGAVAGSTAFFIVNGFKSNAEGQEKKITGGNISNFSKVLYLELIDATFSLDGVLGAFAFTISVPLILIGNGIGAVVVRFFTVRGAKFIQKYSYLKNGAMYSMALLGIIMILESLGTHIYAWLAPLTTFIFVGFFLLLSFKGSKERINP
ncbi:MAG: DUF475 domain-containing protein [Patescibacteria group bacterium]|nr:DUF475 domain-containing protein [Patescibacteria group bacterium]